MPWAQNPRKNDHAVDAVADSLRRFGFGAPILARRADGEIIAGHTRLKAALKLGIDKVPVRYLDLDPADAHLLALADNKTAELAEWDREQLAAIFAQLDADGADLLGSGFGTEEIEALMRQAAARGSETEDPGPDELPEKAVSQPGELFELGPHRLYCGDSTKKESFERLMGRERAHLMITDPPYNVAYEGKTKDALTIENDSMDAERFEAFLLSAFVGAYDVCAPGAAAYVFHADTWGEQFRRTFRTAGFTLRQCLVWVKDQFAMGRQDYQWQHEPVLYGWTPGASHRWFGDRSQKTLLVFNRPKRSEEHPTMKPVDLVEYLAKNSSDRGDVVLDPFGGSGSTLIACARAGRQARLIELDPRYCDVIRRRYTKWAAEARVEAGSGALP